MVRTVFVTAAVLAIGILVLQRYVAQTRGAAIAMVIAWFVLVLAVLVVAVRRRPELRMPALATYAAILVGTVAIGYWTGFRDTEVDEEVAVARTQASGAEREAALRGDSSGAEADGAGTGEAGGEKASKAAGPVSLATGTFAGADGHAGTGKATVVEEPGGERVLTFTDFDVDPGVMVEVYLSTSPADVSDRVELGGLKGNVGDQQYDVPAGADLGNYSNVVLYCTPFSVRIAVAELDA